jgi:hypothetical protein
VSKPDRVAARASTGKTKHNISILTKAMRRSAVFINVSVGYKSIEKKPSIIIGSEDL